jgi:opacity protein-like surface antigen
MKKMKIAMFPALLAMALLSGMSAARAQSYYVDLHVGYNIVDNGDLEYDAATLPAGYEQRPAFGGSFGYMDPSGFRIEGEMTYRDNDINYINGANVKGQLASMALMVNMLYELRIGGGSGYGYGMGSESPLRPYIGIGGGGARFTMDAANDLAAPGIIDDTTYGLVYQGIMGLGVEVTETALVTLDFRYIVSDNVAFSDVAGLGFKVDAIQATAMFGLRTTF